MFKNMLKREELPPVSLATKGLVHRSYEPDKAEARDVARAFARLFSSDDGQKVLAHLQMMTFHRALGPGSSDEQLRYLEGQRAMVATILRLIDKGRKE